jgi:hypothetical protein
MAWRLIAPVERLENKALVGQRSGLFKRKKVLFFHQRPLKVDLESKPA